MFHLVVKDVFEGRPVGSEITDPAEVARILAGHNEAHVVKRAAPPEVAPAPVPAAPAADAVEDKAPKFRG